MAFGFSKCEIVVPSRPSELQRFSMLICGMFCSICVGAIYAFSLISDKMTNDYHFDQNDITTISTVGIVVGYFTLPFGVIYDYCGPKIVFVLGIVLYVTGALIFALIFLDKIGHSVAGLAAINGVLSVGCSLFDMSSILSILSWFPLDHGFVVACVKTMVGLGTSVIATIYNAFFHGMHSEYMFFLMGFVAVIGVISVVVIYLPQYYMTGYRRKTYTEKEHSLAKQLFLVYVQRRAPAIRFFVVFAIVVSLVILIMTQSVVFVFIENPTVTQRRIPAIIMIVLYLSLPFTLLAFKFWGDGSARRAEVAPSDEMGSAQQASRPDVVEEEGDEGKKGSLDGAQAHPTSDDQEVTRYGEPAACDEGEQPVSTENTINLLAADEKLAPQYLTGFLTNICRPVLWCMWINGFCVSGAAVVVYLNVRQIYVAISEDPADTIRPALYVALVSIGSAIGRVAVAFFEVFTQSKPADKRVPLTVVYGLPALLQMIASILFLTVPTEALLVPVLLSGIGIGVYAGAAVLTAQTIFSVDVGKHYISIFFGDILSIIVMNRFLFGELMTRNSTPDENGAPVCLGRDKCIRTTFIVLTCTCALGLSVSIIMHIIYSRYAATVFRERDEKRKAQQSMRFLGKVHSAQE